MAQPAQATPGPAQPLPRHWPDTEFFWASGADGVLRVLRCRSCGRFAHPPGTLCRYCHSRELAPEEVSGMASLWSFTIVYQQFVTWLQTPYVIGIAELAEDPAVHLTTRLVDCEPDNVVIGMPLRVRFERHDDIYLPLFAPAGVADAR